MKHFRVPLQWEMYGYIWVDAETEEEAIEIALAEETHLPEGTYVDDSKLINNFGQFETRD